MKRERAYSLDKKTYTIEDIMVKTGLSLPQVYNQMRHARNPLKYQRVVGEEGNVVRIVSDEDYIAWQLQRKHTGPRPTIDTERLIALHGKKYTQTQIAARLGVTQGAVSMALDRLKLRKILTS